MNAEQELACEIIKSGYNLILIRQAGSGKTYTIQNACKQLRELQIELFNRDSYLCIPRTETSEGCDIAQVVWHFGWKVHI